MLIASCVLPQFWGQMESFRIKRICERKDNHGDDERDRADGESASEKVTKTQVAGLQDEHVRRYCKRRADADRRGDEHRDDDGAWIGSE